MKRVLLSGVALAALMSSASAADIARRAPAAPPVPFVALYNWTGFYVGVNAGGGWSDTKLRNLDMGGSGGLVGGQIGYNWQNGQVVWGLETDIQWANIEASSSCRNGRTCEVTSEWFGTVRGRVGYAGWDRWLLYATGGLAYGDVGANVTGFRGNSDTVVGWTVGGGVEFALTAFAPGPGGWTAKVEYLFVDLDDLECGRGCGRRGLNDVEYQAHIVRAGLNYRF
jgi:outer membrane immunogenic protein